MEYTILPNTDLKISKFCLGSMTWGRQNSEAEAHAQMDFAMDKGINLIDTAEMYPTPAQEETQGLTERYIGNWISKNKNRESLILASKIAGSNRKMVYIRPNLRFSKDALEDAITKSLIRLKTDYIDIYQLHWPERKTNYFGQRDYTHRENDPWEDNFSEVLNHLENFQKQGKIRHVGISNETPYGAMRYMENSRNGKTKIVSIQNPYNLLNRKDEIGLKEIVIRENIGYFAYSPLGFGRLTGKYMEGKDSENSRINIFKHYSRYSSESALEATLQYNEIAKKFNISLTHLSLAFILQQKFITAPILGATSVDQLSENIKSLDIILSKEIIKEINKVHNRIPNPAP